jgi:hypothetical protein
LCRLYRSSYSCEWRCSDFVSKNLRCQLQNRTTKNLVIEEVSPSTTFGILISWVCLLKNLYTWWVRSFTHHCFNNLHVKKLLSFQPIYSLEIYLC